MTTPPGQEHELGALVVAACAGAEGWRATYLGPELPAESIARSVRQLNARAVALSLTYQDQEPAELAEELRRLAAALPAGTALLVGGLAAGAVEDALDEIGAERVNDLNALRSHLRQLAS